MSSNPLKPMISLVLTLVLSVMVCGTAQASPEERLKRIGTALSDEGFAAPERQEGNSNALILVARQADGQGIATLLVRRCESQKDARTACIGGMKRAEELRIKCEGKEVMRRRVRLKGATNTRLMRFGVPDESGSVVILVFACGPETVELTVVGKPTPKSMKRIASKVVQTLSQISSEGAPFSKSAPANGGAAGSLAPGRVMGIGTGFYVTETEVLSNAHVVGDAKEVRLVATNGSRSMGKVIARGKGGTNVDLALIKTTRRGRPLTLAQPRNLQNVFAYGYGALGGLNEAPLLATEGRISGRHKGTLITTAHINPGNSGGPLVDTSGRAVGVVFAKSFSDATVESLGYVIPCDIANAWLRSNGVRLRLDQTEATGTTPDDARVREAVVRIERLVGR